MFVDRAKIYIKSGKGGDGAGGAAEESLLFRRGGPDGGDGGRGGDVIFMADRNLRTLHGLQIQEKIRSRVRPKRHEKEAFRQGRRKPYHQGSAWNRYHR